MTAPTAPGRSARVTGILRRTPATIATILVVLVVGVLSRGLWEPFVESAGMYTWAYGLPALDDGRWWTPITGTFFVVQPLVYIPTLLGLGALGALEYLRGSRVALAYFWIGQLFGVFASALLLSLLRLFSGWTWAQEAASSLDVGPSAGALACIAALVGLAPAPWRTRGWMLLLSAVIVAVLVFGTVADLEDLFAVLLILVVDRTLRPQRATVREQRLVAFTGMLAFVAIETILAIVPTDGPFGGTEPLGGSFWSTAVDVVVVVVIANGLLQARRWAWVVAIILMSINVLGAIGLALLLPVAGDVDVDVDVDVTPLGTAALEIGTGALSLLMLIYLISVRGAFARHRRTTLGGGAEPTVDEASALLRRAGGSTLSWMTTWDGNDYFRTSTGIVTFQKRVGAVIALAGPLGPAEGRAQSVGEFIHAAEHAGLVPCFFSVGETVREAVPDTWRSLVVADDTIVDLPGLAFTGKAWNSVRTSMNKAGREDMTFRLTRLADEPWGVRAQLNAISEQWVGDKDLPEMRFTLGTLAEADDPEVRIALAIDPHGTVDGFLSWLPIYGDDGRGVRGWTLDIMRRREGGFGPVMEYLIASSAVAFRDEGAEIMSLSGAPLAHEYPPEASMLAALSARLSDGLASRATARAARRGPGRRARREARARACARASRRVPGRAPLRRSQRALLRAS